MRKVKRRWRTVHLLAAAVTVMTAVFPLNVQTALAAGDGKTEEISKVWDFSDGTQGWRYDDSWAGDSYTGEGSLSWDEEQQMVKVSLDYSGNTDNGWSQTGISVTEEGGIDYSPYKVLSFDLYYDTGAFTTGQITVKPYSDGIFQDQMSNISQALSVDAGGTRKMVTLSMICDAAAVKTEKPGTLMLLLIGNNTDYRGDIWLDNIKLSSVKEEKFLVDSTVRPETKTRISSSAAALNINGGEHPYAETVDLADEDAEASSVALYQYLKAVGQSDSTLYGHMEDTVLKAGSGELTESDTKDVTGSLAAVVGFDCGDLFRGYAAKYNARHLEAGLPETNAGNIQAAALFANEAIREGAVVTLSAHVPNFSAIPKKEGSFEHSYDGFDFLAADSYHLTGDAANQILPGGQYHDRLTAYLDMVADYAKQVEGPILFRPWHENTGSWFWWGKAFCDAETYKSIYKFTVEYLRDERDVHNILYVYGPGSEAASMEEYEERYPGDSWVDMVGFDTYDNNPVPDSEGYTFQKTFEQAVNLTDAFAKKHGKLFAVTETGMAALPETGNRRPEWYSEILDIITKPEYDCCYFMLWSNYSRTGSYYSPFVQEVKDGGTLFGHELLDPFLKMYNSEKSIFAVDQEHVIRQVMQGEIKEAKREAGSETEGYITAPMASSRVLEPQTIAARLNREGENVYFIVSGGGKEWKLEASTAGKQAEAWLDEKTLSEIGQAADGKIAMFAGEEKLQEISVLYNIKPRPKDPFLVDDFESYAGLPNLLMGSWSTNKDSGCSLELSLIKEYAYDGEYALSFDYTETKNGWAGCELSKEADWSGCNALQFLTVPDGNNHKIVVQINTSTGGSYEAYLQDYPEYAQSTEPLLVTLPFEEFTDKNGAGKLNAAAAASVRGIGLWLNAIPDSEAIGDSGEVKGTLVYDAIRAGYVEDPKPVFEKVNLGAAGFSQGEKGIDMTDQAAAAEMTENQNAVEIQRRNQVVMVISGAAAILSLLCLLWLILGMRKTK